MHILSYNVSLCNLSYVFNFILHAILSLCKLLCKSFCKIFLQTEILFIALIVHFRKPKNIGKTKIVYIVKCLLHVKIPVFVLTNVLKNMQLMFLKLWEMQSLAQRYTYRFFFCDVYKCLKHSVTLTHIRTC